MGRAAAVKPRQIAKRLFPLSSLTIGVAIAASQVRRGEWRADRVPAKRQSLRRRGDAQRVITGSQQRCNRRFDKQISFSWPDQ
jgi:Flp pilus assembly protein CpaB